MASALAFDTHAYVKKLRDAGVPEPQAEVQVEVLTTLLEERMVSRRDLADVEVALKRDIKELETRMEARLKELEVGLKRDIKELEASLRRDIKELETRMETRFKELETTMETRFKEQDTKLRELEMRLLIRLGSLGIVGIGIVATLVKIL